MRSPGIAQEPNALPVLMGMESGKFDVSYVDIYDCMDALRIMDQLSLDGPLRRGADVPAATPPPQRAKKWTGEQIKDAKELLQRLRSVDFFIVPSVLLMSGSVPYNEW